MRIWEPLTLTIGPETENDGVGLGAGAIVATLAMVATVSLCGRSAEACCAESAGTAWDAPDDPPAQATTRDDATISSAARTV